MVRVEKVLRSKVVKFGVVVGLVVGSMGVSAGASGSGSGLGSGYGTTSGRCGSWAGHGDVPDLATRGCMGISMEDSAEVEEFWRQKVGSLVSAKIREGGGDVYLGFLKVKPVARDRIVGSVLREMRGVYGEVGEEVGEEGGTKVWRWGVARKGEGRVAVRLVE